MTMKTAIIIANPKKEGLNRSMLEAVKKGLDKKGKEYVVYDLYEMNYDPNFTIESFEIWGNAVYPYTEYQDVFEQLSESTDEIILIFPLIMCGFPPNLYGFLNKMFVGSLIGSSKDPEQWNPMAYVERAYVYGTSLSHNMRFKSRLGEDFFEKYFEAFLTTLGIEEVKTDILEGLHSIPRKNITQYINDLEEFHSK